MKEDKNCKPWEKPYYHVWEAAAYWCGIMDRNILVDDKGLPAKDPQNDCLRSRAEWIMDAIDCGELECGRDGRSVPNETIARPKRTVRRSDLIDWFKKNVKERPEFLFDEIDRNTHAAINKESFLSLQANIQAEQVRHDKTKEQLQEMANKLSAMEHERDSLKIYSEKLAKQIEMDSPADKKRKITYLHIIGALVQIIMDKELFGSAEQLRGFIAYEHPGVQGCSETTMATIFAEAKRLINSK
jgi:hypothetical protein